MMDDFTPTPERQKQILALPSKQGCLSVNEIVEQLRELAFLLICEISCNYHI
jgi:hypothetical protein